MKIDEIRDLLKEVKFGNYSFIVDQDVSGNMRLYATFEQMDIETGQTEMQVTRKWVLSQFMTKSEIVQTVFKLCLTSVEHHARETFKYRDRRIFGPHFNVDALHRVCGDREFDYRRDDA